MARRRSILGSLWLGLTLQAAFAVSAANAAEAAESTFARDALLCASADDAFVMSAAACEQIAAPAPISFEDFSTAFYLSPEPRYYNGHVDLPDLDAALLGGPEPSTYHSDDFILLN